VKIAVTGKGGVGKTTFSSVLARLYAEEGRGVLTADVDPDANLGMALGFTPEELDSITPISKMSELIAERTGATPETFGRFFKINPRVDDIPDRFALEKNGVKLLVMGTVDNAGAGCVCPENVMIKRVLSHLVLRRDEVVIMDMEAGLEHFGRGTADFVDRFVVVIEPGERSIQTYRKVKALSAEMGVKKVSVVANKIRSEADKEYIISRIPADELLGFVTFNDDTADADRRGLSPFDSSPGTVEQIRIIKGRIDEEENK